MTKACPGFLPVTEKRHGCLTPKEGAPDVCAEGSSPAAGSHSVPHGGQPRGVQRDGWDRPPGRLVPAAPGL